MREDRFQPADQLGRVHVLRVAVDHAHHDHAVVPHLDVDHGRMRQGRRSGARCAGRCGHFTSSTVQNRRAVEAAPLPQQHRRAQRRGFCKRQRGRQHVGRAGAGDESRAGRKRIAGDSGRAEQTLPGHVVAEAPREQRHRLPQQRGMLPERIGRAVAVVAVDAGVGTQAEQPADAVGIVFEGDDDRDRERRQGRLQRHPCGDGLRFFGFAGIGRKTWQKPGQKAGMIAAQHHRDMPARR